MLDSIGESNVRMTTRADYNQVVGDKTAALQKVEKNVEERPIENTDKGANSEFATNQETSGYRTDENVIVFEKYDEKGNVIYRVPPEKQPIDEHA